jgi:GAF domain-containing protein
MNHGTFIGFIVCTRRQAGMLADHHVQLLRTFADQAVIAIENARLFNETQEALERQTATAGILKVIASSPSDVQPVFEAIATSANQLLGGFSTSVCRFRDGAVHLEAFTPVNPDADEFLKKLFPMPFAEYPPLQLVRNGETIQYADTETAPDVQARAARARGFRSIVLTPLMSNGAAIGLISVTRTQTGSFGDHHVELLRTFADQAVIAIENTRLFNETKEALERQTATAEILKVIASSPSDMQPVFDAIANSANRLIGGFSAAVFRYIDDRIHLAAFTPTDAEGDAVLQSSFPSPLAEFPPYQLTRDGAPAELPDTELEPAARDIARARGYRSMLFAPLMNDGAAVGIITVTRVAPGPFGEQHTRLLQMFADQAVIAIKNVGLFDEVQQRTEDLSEALQQQTATADVLKVISRSAFDLEIVLDTLTASAASLCNADVAAVARPHPEGGYHHATRYNFPPEWEGLIETIRLYPDRGSLVGRVLLEGKAVQINDVLADSEYAFPEHQRGGGYRTLLGVPLLREGQPTGVLFLGRRQVEPFTDRQIELVQTYADQAVIAIENVRLFDEVQAKTRDLSEALTYQTGSANILRVIASSPTDVKPVLQAIVESACELCGAYDALVRLKDGDELAFGAHHGPLPVNSENVPVSENSTAGLAVIGRKPVHVHDLLSTEGDRFPHAQALALGERTILSVPLLREDEGIGAIVIRRREVNPFSDKQIALLQTFADQAVIAIGNVRLFEEVQAKTRELSEALTYQTGSANILKVIASTPTDVEPSLKAIVESACELCEAYDAVAVLQDGEYLRFGAHHGPIPMSIDKWPINRRWTAGRAFVDKRPVHVHDLLAEGDEFPDGRELSLRMGHRTTLSVPLLRENESIGSLVLRRTEVNPFTDKQIALLQTFADQAVIAIGNVRLFEEVQQRTRELSESLQFQTASSEVLKVISRSPDTLQPVLDTIAQTSHELCGSDAATILLFREGKAHFAAVSGEVPKHIEFMRANPGPIDEPNSLFERLIREKRTLHFPNVMDDPELSRHQRVALGGPRALLVAPLLQDGEAVGAIVLRQSQFKPFTERQIQAIEVFADQAVIAISNVNLFEEVQQRTRELSESLEQQVATSEVLQVISSSPGELEPVFQSMLANATRLCEAECGVMWLREADAFRSAAIHGPLPPAYVEQWRSGTPVHPDPHGPLTILAQTRKAVHIPDMREDRSYLDGHPLPVAAVDVAGIRTLLLVPMSKEDELVGGIAIYRQEVRPFTDKQVELVSTFARQAVIAIENARLLKELRQRTDDLSESLQQQTATADVLQIISSSPGDLAPVFEKMLENATHVCGAKFGSMLLVENGVLQRAALYNVPAEFAAARGNRPLVAHPNSALAAAINTKQVVHVADMRTTEAYLQRSPASVELVELGGARTVAIVPMLRDDEVIGAITVYRDEVRLFGDKQIDLLSNFAKQAVIAIENARLLKELRQRTDDLSKSLDDLRTAQDRLVQTEKLASLGQLTAGIAHEIKNPLNFVNNFAALSAELTDELKDHLNTTMLADAVRKEVDELTGLLKDNLAKVVQHGKRADSIIKNMLLHSREGSGEHRPSDINALVDESLNLAYHGARAEKSDFNVTLERDFGTDAGEVDLFPQEITRVLLNLISNGFYAVTKRRKEGGEPGFEPTLRASTKSLGESIEIRIRDNGTGIPPEVKEKMFNPFFTTKPAGEGTGLGLSMSHDIIVKQHGGTIDVDTEQGHFTEFRIVLPRTSNFADKSRG